jgi:circadian clock protein KaiC
MRNALVALLLAACTTTNPPTPSRLETTPRHDEWVTIDSAGRPLHAYVVYPQSSAKAGAVLVIHENRGLTDWVRTVADRVAEMGYIAVAPDMLSGSAPNGGRTSDFATSDAAREAISKLPREQVLADLANAAKYVRTLPAANGKLAVMGFCWGGSRAWDAANTIDDLSAASVFYGTGPSTDAGVTGIEAPVYGFYGGDDDARQRDHRRDRGADEEARQDLHPGHPSRRRARVHATRRRGRTDGREQGSARPFLAGITAAFPYFALTQQTRQLADFPQYSAWGNGCCMTKSDVAATGIEGLDHILLGGFPRNHVYLLQGDPGVGKTTLGLQFLLEGVRNGERALYLTLSETRDELQAVAKSHNWDFTGINVYEQLVAEQSLEDDETTVFYPSEIELGQTIKAMLTEVDRVKPDRVVLDSLSEIRLLAQSTLRYRKQILALKQFFAKRNATVLFLDDRTAEVNDLQLQSVPHGVIELERYTPLYGSARRRLQLVKVRGLNFRDGYHDFSIRTGGIVVYPRLVAAEHRRFVAQEQVQCGVTALDEMLGGGIDRGTSTLVMGPAGAGKSALSTQYAVGAAKRGERAAMFIFEESTSSLFHRSASLGMPLRELADAEQIIVRQVDPAQLQPGEFASLVRGVVEDEGVRVLVIDSLNGYLNAVPEERFLLLHLHELLSYLGQHGVATVLVFAQHGLVGTMHSTVDVSYLADSVILLRYFEANGKIRKAVSIVKKRGGCHDTSIRDFTMTSNGLSIGPPLEHFRGVLTGVPTYDNIVREIKET